MPDLQLDESHDSRQILTRPGQGEAGSAAARTAAPGWDGAAVRAAAKRAAATVAPRALWRDHRLFTIVATISLLPRLLAALAFRPGLLTSDSFLYMQEASKRVLGQIRPSGYSFFLGILQPFPHVLLAVTTAQHLMGIAIAAIVYGLLRYWGLPAWGATLAALPTLFDPRQIALESYILPDTLFTLVLMIIVAVLLTKSTPRRWQCVIAGLGLAYVAVLRSNGIPLALVAAVFLLVRRVGWRALAAGAVAFVLPLLSYVWVFHSEYGQFNITTSDGIFLWSGTTGFANCAIIKPPPDLQPLCPNRAKSVPSRATPPWSVSALLNSPAPAAYLWAPDAWWRHDAHPGINPYNDSLGMRFAIDAIKAQPLDYLRVTARDVLLIFLSTDRPLNRTSMNFTLHGRYAKLPSYYADYEHAFAGTTENTHAVQPWAYFMFLYSEPVYFPGLVFFAVLVAGFVGIVRRRKRPWRTMGVPPALLPWLLAAVSIVIPAMLKESLYRYAMVAIPLGCLAAGLAFTRQRTLPAAPAADMPAGTAAATPAPGSPVAPPRVTASPTSATLAGPPASAAPATPTVSAAPAAPADPAATASGAGRPQTTTQAAPSDPPTATGQAPQSDGEAPDPPPGDHP